MKKKICTLVLTFVMLFSAASACLISVSATEEKTLKASDTDFTINSTGLDITTLISGNKDDGYRFNVGGVGRVQLVTQEQYPIAKATFDIQLMYNGVSYGFFGISKNGEIVSDPLVTDSNNISFIYETGNNGKCLYISVKGSDSQNVRIAEILPVGSDAFWKPSVINVSFVKKGGHWYLAVNGVACNNIEANIESAQLERYFGLKFFENAEKAYFRFGINAVAGTDNNLYFKSMTAFENDWQSTAVNTYAFTYSNIVREYRGQGITNETLFSAIPGFASGSRTDGHVIDFTGTDGYAQTADGFDLKTTTFKVAPIVDDDNKSTLWYYLGFTANPSVLKDHSSKPDETVEFNLASVYNDNYTGGWVITNTNDTAAKPTQISLGKTGQWKTHRTESTYITAPMIISFVQETGPDNQLHWYMRTNVSGNSITVKSQNASTDIFLRFDDIIDRKVYFRMGTVSKAEYNLKMYCKVSNWPESSGIEDISAEEQAAVIELEKRISEIGAVTPENYKETDAELQSIRKEMEKLSAAARDYLSVQELVKKEKEVAALKALYECGDWYVKDGLTTYSGDKWINYKFADALSAGQPIVATTSGDYDITKNSLYWKGINVPGGSWFLFGLTNNMQSELLPANFNNGINFILTPSANALVVQFWDATSKKAVYIGENSRFEAFEYYNKTKEHYFTMVKQNGHWYIKIDDVVFDGQHFDAIDSYMEQYATATKVRFAGCQGLGECTVNIVDPTVDDSVIPDEIAADVQAFDQKVNDLGGVAAITKENASKMREKVNELLAEYESLSSRIKKYVSTKGLLDSIDRRLELMEQADAYGDWYTSQEELTYVKNDDGSYDFSSAYGIDSSYATTTEPYDFTAMGFEWTGVKVPSSTWFAFGLSADYTLLPLQGNTSQNLTFILTPRNSDIVVQYWDGDSRKAVMLAELTNAVYNGFNLFNLELTHTYGMVKKSDGHWYLYIDNKLFDGKYYDTIDMFMETYGKSAYVSFGAYKGADACNVRITESEYSDGSVIIDSSNVKGELTPAQQYLQLLEENYVEVWEYNEPTTAVVFNVWNKLDYRSKLDVEAVLIDDDYMWEIHNLVATYAPELYDFSAALPDTGDTYTVMWALAIGLAAISAFAAIGLIRMRKNRF